MGITARAASVPKMVIPIRSFGRFLYQNLQRSFDVFLWPFPSCAKRGVYGKGQSPVSAFSFLLYNTLSVDVKIAMIAKNTAPKYMGLGNLVAIFPGKAWFSHVVEARVSEKLLPSQKRRHNIPERDEKQKQPRGSRGSCLAFQVEGRSIKFRFKN